MTTYKTYKHNDVIPCDYKISPTCLQFLMPGEGTPHSGFVNPKTQKLSDKVKWCCRNCESAFDEN